MLGLIALAPFSAGSVTEAPPEEQASFLAWDSIAERLGSSEVAALAANQLRGLPLALQAEVKMTSPFVWPSVGDITSYMDSSHPMGIDIRLDPEADSPIVAAAGGVVDFAGGSDDLAYGYYVSIDHGDGLVTLYAHLSEIFVSEGQELAQGELLGLGGATGKSTGKHLHFEVRVWDQLADPLVLLPVTPGDAITGIDCGSGELVLLRGATATLDFTASLPDDVRIARADLVQNGDAPAGTDGVTVTPSERTVEIATTPRVNATGSPGAESHRLDLRLEGRGEENRSCAVRLATMDSYFVAYSDAALSAAASTEGEFEAEPPAPPSPAPVEPTAAPPPPEPSPPVPIVIPTDIPLLGELRSPAAQPDATETPAPTSTPAPTETPTQTPTPSPTPTATATPTEAPED